MAPEGGACVAAAHRLKASGHIGPDDTVVLFDTGSGYKYTENMEPLWHDRTPVPSRPHAPRARRRAAPERGRDPVAQPPGPPLLSRAFVETAGAETIAFHLGSDVTTIDLDRP